MNLRFRIYDSRKVIKEFTDLKTWQECHQFVIMIYKITKSFPKEELFALSTQLKRSGISITNIIAEGFGRHSYKEKVQLLPSPGIIC